MVQYAYTEMAGGVNNSRLTSITYPDGYVVNYNYGTSGSLNDTISRLDSLSDSSGTLESYKYLGLDTVVERDHPQTGVNLTYISQIDSTGDAGDSTSAWTVRPRRRPELVRHHDQHLGGRLPVRLRPRRQRALPGEHGRCRVQPAVQLRRPEPADRASQHGTLNSDHDGITGTPTASQSWSLDALGNCTSVTTNGTTQTNTANQQNEYTAIGSATPTYDANGNLTTDETGQQYVYDAWNRLVAVKNSSGTTHGQLQLRRPGPARSPRRTAARRRTCTSRPRARCWRSKSAA